MRMTRMYELPDALSQLLPHDTPGKVGGPAGDAFDLVYVDVANAVRAKMHRTDPVLADYIECVGSRPAAFGHFHIPHKLSPLATAATAHTLPADCCPLDALGTTFPITFVIPGALQTPLAMPRTHALELLLIP